MFGKEIKKDLLQDTMIYLDNLKEEVSSLKKMVERMAKKLGFVEQYGFMGKYFLDDVPLVKQKDIDEIKDILKEAGIIVTPPKNISVPDPRGYSVNKIK
jgi:hypothetical protein